MLRMRSDQVHLFHQLRREAVVRELSRDIGVFAPKLADVIGEEGRSIAACTALDVARRHGFVRRSSVRLILQLMASLGVEFTTDPQLPWASEILYRTRDQPEETRRQRLYRRVVAFMDEVHGENNRNAIQALQRMFPDDASLTPRVPANSKASSSSRHASTQRRPSSSPEESCVRCTSKVRPSPRNTTSAPKARCSWPVWHSRSGRASFGIPFTLES